MRGLVNEERTSRRRGGHLFYSFWRVNLIWYAVKLCCTSPKMLEIAEVNLSLGKWVTEAGKSKMIWDQSSGNNLAEWKPKIKEPTLRWETTPMTFLNILCMKQCQNNSDIKNLGCPPIYYFSKYFQVQYTNIRKLLVLYMTLISFLQQQMKIAECVGLGAFTISNFYWVLLHCSSKFLVQYKQRNISCKEIACNIYNVTLLNQ